MNKEGKIILLDTDKDTLAVLCDQIKKVGHKNEIECFSDPEEAGQYVRENITTIFLLLQSSTTSGIMVPDTRNMVYLHEKFSTDVLPYMFLVLTNKKTPVHISHTFIHCYYRPAATEQLITTLTSVITFWKDHVFPPRIQSF